MKVVINRCYGGFSLSPRAVQRLAELQGKECYFFDFNFERHTHRPIAIAKCRNSLSWRAYSVPNPDEVAMSQVDWRSMSDADRALSNKQWSAISIETRPENRADPLLVQVVEELGVAANGDHAELKVVEIPDGIEWEIGEYDGMERVEEVHRTWC